MKRKKELIVILSSLLVIVLSVSVAYFTTKILGEGKEISVESADLKVIFTSGSGTINGTNIEPGWSSGENTFTVKNESNGTYKYNIIIKDLVNTFVTTGFLQYKITSTDGGYTMTGYADVPKSSTSADTTLAENISIEKGTTHTYKIIINYNNSDEVDQSADMGKMLSGKIFITKGTKIPNLANKILEDNPTISTRSDFSTPFITNTTNTLYKTTENDIDVYYFAGIDETPAHCDYNGQTIYVETGSFLTQENCTSGMQVCKIDVNELRYGVSGPTCFGEYGGEIVSLNNVTWKESEYKPINNWVKFGKYKSDLIKYRGFINATTTTIFREYSTMEECTSSATSYNVNCTAYKYASAGDDMYWRIIRTNADGSIRLLYHGTSTKATDAYIGTSKFNEKSNDSMYVGYMYGTSGSQESNRTNTNNSTIKTAIDNWYASNMTSYTKYLSTTAVYCNDREVGSGTYSATGSKFNYAAYTRLLTSETPTYDCTNDNDKFTVDASTGNGKLTYPIALMTADEIAYAGGKYGQNAPMWYYTNSSLESSTDTTYWWSLSPSKWNGSIAYSLHVSGSGNPGSLYDSGIDSVGVRPAVSLKSCIKYRTGNGTSETPYEIVETLSGC